MGIVFPIRVSLGTGIIELRLERPEAKNAIGKEMLQGLRSAIKEVEADATANVVLVASSVPKVFCAGADLKVAAALTVILKLQVCDLCSIDHTEYVSVATVAYCLLSFDSTYAARFQFSLSVAFLYCFFGGELLRCISQCEIPCGCHISSRC